MAAVATSFTATSDRCPKIFEPVWSNGCAGSLCHVEGVGFFTACVTPKTAVSFLRAASLLLDLQTIQHSLECGPQLGKTAEAREAVKRMPSGGHYRRDLLEACVGLRPASELDRMAQEAETGGPSDPDPENAYYQGTLFAYAGKKEAAFHLLKVAIDKNYCAYSQLRSDPFLAKLRPMPEFNQLLTAAQECQQAVQSNGATPSQ
jgi:hypothetical protein